MTVPSGDATITNLTNLSANKPYNAAILNSVITLYSHCIFLLYKLELRDRKVSYIASEIYIMPRFLKDISKFQRGVLIKRWN